VGRSSALNAVQGVGMLVIWRSLMEDYSRRAFDMWIQISRPVFR
jgi:hypothetical protein